MNKLVVVLSAVLLTACVTRGPTLSERMAERAGQTYKQVVLEKGPPNVKTQVDETSFMATWVASSTTRYTQYRSWEEACKLNYLFTDNVVTAWSYEGYCK